MIGSNGMIISWLIFFIVIFYLPKQPILIHRLLKSVNKATGSFFFAYLFSFVGDTPAPPPNIVIIVADDLGYNDVSWHNEIVKTPNLEELARAGVLLEQHYSQPVCTPTRAALLTGR